MRKLPRLLLQSAVILLLATGCGSSQTDQPSSTPLPATPTTAASPTTSVAATAEDQASATALATADTIYHNGVVLTMNAANPRAEGFAVRDGTLLTVGSEAEVLAHAGPDTARIDLEGLTVLPGFIDPHSHILNDHAAFGTDLLGAQALALENGITTMGNMYTGAELVDELRSLDAAGELKLRTSLYLAITTNCGEPTGDWWREFTPSTTPGQRLRVQGLKAFADGGTCGEIAASEDILPGYGEGEPFFQQAAMDTMFAEAERHGFQLAVHAQGDRAVEQVLTALATVNADGHNPLRHRIEHNSLVRHELRPLYQQYDVVATLFGYHPVCDLPEWSEFYQEIGEDLRGMLASNPQGHFAWHGDDPAWPPISPLLELASMATRLEPDGSGAFCQPPAWLEEKKLSAQAALPLMTTGGAYALFRESEVGSLAAGKHADFVLLNNDPTRVDANELWDLELLATFMDGVPVYCSPAQEELCARFADPIETQTATPAGAEPLADSIVTDIRVSEELPDFPAAGVVDGRTDGTPWVSGFGPPQWIEFDLGETRSLAGLRLWVDQDPAGLTRHRILGGPNPDPSTELAVIEGETTWGQMLEVNGSWQVRYLRIETVISPSWVAWLEVEFLPAP